MSRLALSLLELNCTVQSAAVTIEVPGWMAPKERAGPEQLDTSRLVALSTLALTTVELEAPLTGFDARHAKATDSEAAVTIRSRRTRGVRTYAC